jgi:asparagine synthase (glutamine-hydrolysing)
MCGFVGFADFKNDVSSQKNILLNMNSTLSKRGPDEDGYYIEKNIALGHKRLIVIDPERWQTAYD